MLLFPGPLAHFAVVEDQVVPWGRYQPTPFHYLHVLSGVVLTLGDEVEQRRPQLATGLDQIVQTSSFGQASRHYGITNFSIRVNVKQGYSEMAI
jgi:hypothetical protein